MISLARAKSIYALKIPEEPSPTHFPKATHTYTLSEEHSDKPPSKYYKPPTYFNVNLKLEYHTVSINANTSLPLHAKLNSRASQIHKTSSNTITTTPNTTSKMAHHKSRGKFIPLLVLSSSLICPPGPTINNTPSYAYLRAQRPRECARYDRAEALGYPYPSFYNTNEQYLGMEGVEVKDFGRGRGRQERPNWFVRLMTALCG